MNRVYLVRHGENPANLTKEFSYIKINHPLTAKGVLQAEQTADHFKDMDIHEIYASPLVRARQTAEIIANPLGLEVIEMDIFREVNVGSLEGHQDLKKAWEINAQVVTSWVEGQPETAYPDGENLLEIQKRMRKGLEQVVSGKTERNIMVVAHGGIFTFSIFNLCSNIELSDVLKQENHNCSITEIEVEQQNGDLHCRLVAWASFEHMHGEAARVVSPVLKDEEELPRNP